MNLFEVHVNRDQQNVLGRQGKTDEGFPDVSRAKAIKKRRETFLQEYKSKNKDNLFLDRRISEKNSLLSEENKALVTFAVEKIRAHEKKNIYNLNEQEVLTHRGQTLEEIKKFDDLESVDEEGDDGS